MAQLTVPQGAFALEPHPTRAGHGRRAWDAADAYLLRHLAEVAATRPLGSVAILNDASGALATVLAPHRPTVVGDSFLARRATVANLLANGVDPATVARCTSLDPPAGPFATLLVKVPKSLDQLEDQLQRLRPALADGALVVGAGMARHIHTSTLAVFERVLGPTTTSRAEQKARLVFSDVTAPVTPTTWPRSFTVPADALPASTGAIVAVGHAGVFAAGKLDIGTRLLLAHLPHHDASSVVDLGCGTGLLATAYARAHPRAEVLGIDESDRAVASTEATFAANLGPDRSARAVPGDGLFDLDHGPPIAAGSVDLVLNNPPFHDDHAVGDATAWRMFRDAHRALRPGGELWVVGNRHLGHHAKLGRLFGGCTTVAANPKFVVLRAER